MDHLLDMVKLMNSLCGDRMDIANITQTISIPCYLYD